MDFKKRGSERGGASFFEPKTSENRQEALDQIAKSSVCWGYENTSAKPPHTGPLTCLFLRAAFGMCD